MVISYCLILQLIFIYFFFVSLFFTGSGQRFFQRRLRLVTFISTHFTTSSSKPSMFFFFRAHYLCYKLSKSSWGLTWRTPKNVWVRGEGLIGFCELFKCPRPFWCFLIVLTKPLYILYFTECTAYFRQHFILDTWHCSVLALESCVVSAMVH